MIKDRLTEAIEANYEKIKKGDDHIPIGMRGELEVIVKDRDGNIISYERDHNQVTKLAKMALLHLLAGEIGTVDSEAYSVAEGTTAGLRTYAVTDVSESLPELKKQIFPSFVPGNHTLNTDEQSETPSTNLDGQMVSGEPYFFNGANYQDSENNTRLSQVAPMSDGFSDNAAIKFNFPTKMLFGTGLEDYSSETIGSTYQNDLGAAVNSEAICILNGYDASNTLPTKFFYGCSSSTLQDYPPSQEKRLSNWYSASKFRSRTLQPASTQPIKTNPTSNDTAIKGAIKNCFIESSSDSSLYNPSTKMAINDYRGYGYPCFIYAKRDTQSFYVTGDNENVFYSVNDSLGSSPYETEVTYTVVMPAQPVASQRILTFYPYNGWVLRQAGLFCDSRYKIRSSSSTTYAEATMLSNANSGIEDQVTNTYRNSVGGQLLFTRNLSSPIIKTPDNVVTFIWRIFITV